MKTTKLLITCLFCCAVCSCSNAKNDTKQNVPEWVPLSAETRENIVTDYVEALDKFNVETFCVHTFVHEKFGGFYKIMYFCNRKPDQFKLWQHWQ